MLRKVLLILAVILVGFAAIAAPSLKVGSPPPDFSLKDLNGSTISLDNYLGSKVVVVSFFASWSRSCQAELAFLDQLTKDHSSRNVKVIGVSFDRKTKDLKKFVKDNNISFSVLQDKKLKTLRDYRILIIPTLFVIDKSGNIHNIYVDFDKNVAQAVSEEVGKLINPAN